MLEGDWIMQDNVFLNSRFSPTKGILMDLLLFVILITTETYLCDLIKNDVIFDKWAGTINAYRTTPNKWFFI